MKPGHLRKGPAIFMIKNQTIKNKYEDLNAEVIHLMDSIGTRAFWRELCCLHKMDMGSMSGLERQTISKEYDNSQSNHSSVSF